MMDADTRIIFRRVATNFIFFGESAASCRRGIDIDTEPIQIGLCDPMARGAMNDSAMNVPMAGVGNSRTPR